MDGAVAKRRVDVVGPGGEVCGQGAGRKTAAALLRSQEQGACSQNRALMVLLSYVLLVYRGILKASLHHPLGYGHGQ